MNISGISTNHEKQQIGFGMAVKVMHTKSKPEDVLAETVIKFLDKDTISNTDLVKKYELERNPYIIKLGELIRKYHPNPLKRFFYREFPDAHAAKFDEKSLTGAHKFYGNSQEAENAIAENFKAKGFKVKQTPFVKNPE